MIPQRDVNAEIGAIQTTSNFRTLIILLIEIFIIHIENKYCELVWFFLILTLLLIIFILFARYKIMSYDVLVSYI